MAKDVLLGSSPKVGFTLARIPIQHHAQHCVRSALWLLPCVSYKDTQSNKQILTKQQSLAMYFPISWFGPASRCLKLRLSVESHLWRNPWTCSARHNLPICVCKGDLARPCYLDGDALDHWSHCLTIGTWRPVLIPSVHPASNCSTYQASYHPTEVTWQGIEHWALLSHRHCFRCHRSWLALTWSKYVMPKSPTQRIFHDLCRASYEGTDRICRRISSKANCNQVSQFQSEWNSETTASNDKVQAMPCF